MNDLIDGINNIKKYKKLNRGDFDFEIIDIKLLKFLN